MGLLASSIFVPLAKFSLNYADILLKGITHDRFARKPQGFDTNNPAFVYGHLAIYPERVFDLIGRPELARPDQRFIDLFSAGKPCLDDPDARIYPAMDEIIARFRTRYEALLPVLAETSDEPFARINPNEKMRDRFPTVGAAVNFLISGHMMIHLGQVSAWRRCMGLGSAM